QFTSDTEPSEDPKFSPDGTRLAFIRRHNLYVHPISKTSETRLTKDKDENLLNGEVDWVYAEELSVRSNYFWSPDSRNIVFLQTDETRVPTYPIVDWLPTHPHAESQHYPKAGDPNPVVRLAVVKAAGGKPKFITLTDDPDVYVPRFGWVNDGIVWAQVLNRTQDRMDLYFADAHSGKARKVLSESVSDGWVNVNDDMRVWKSGDRFLWSSWRDGHTHLYLYSFDKQNPLAGDARLERQLEKGDYEVVSVEAVDGNAVYFTSNQDDARRRGVFSVGLGSGDVRRLSQPDGWHTASFSDDAKYWLDRFSNASTPWKWSLCGGDGSQGSAVWASRGVADYGLVPQKFLEFKADDGTTLYGQLLL